jgi:hypothetical protein
MGGFHQDPEVTMDPRGVAVRKSALSVLAINQAAIFQVTQCKPNCNTADIKPATKLMFAGNWKGNSVIPLEDFLR